MSVVSFWRDLTGRLFQKDDPDSIARDGHAAARWLEDDTLNGALAEVRAKAVDVWRVSRDPETRERAWLMLQQTDLFVIELEKAKERKDLQEALIERQH